MQSPSQMITQARREEKPREESKNTIQQKLESKEKELSKDQQKYNQCSQFDEQILAKIRNFIQTFENTLEGSQKQKVKKILFCLFKRASSKYFQKYLEDSQKIEQNLALLSLTIQLYNAEFNRGLKWDNIEEYFEVPSFIMWKTCNLLKVSDLQMHHSINNLKEIQKKYIAYKLWNNQRNIDYLVAITNNKTDNKLAHILLFQLLSQTATLIQKITNFYSFKLKKKQEIFTIMKVIFRSHTNFLSNVILTHSFCALFLLFRSSIDWIIRLFSSEMNIKDSFDKVIKQINVQDREEKLNIIRFFNQKYVMELKESIFEFKPSVQQETTLFSEKNNLLTATFQNILNAEEMKKVFNQIKLLVCEVPISSEYPLWQKLRTDIDEIENLLIVDRDFAFSENNLELMRKELSLIKKNSYPSQFLDMFTKKNAKLIQNNEPRRIHLKLIPQLQSEEGEAIPDLQIMTKKITTKSQPEIQSNNQSVQSSKENNPSAINLLSQNPSE